MTTELQQLKLEMDRNVHDNVLLAAGVGLVPVPLVDFVGLTIVNVKMLRVLSETANKPFSDNLGKSIVIALLAGIGIPRLALAGSQSISKWLPVIGPSFATVAMPVFSGGITYAIGQLFAAHLRNGGSCLDFNVTEQQEEMAAAYEEGKASVEAEMEPATA